MKKTITSIALIASLAAFSITITGCGSSSSSTISTDGSTSMEEVIQALGEQFQKDKSGLKVTYNPTGSGSGIQAVQEGRCDIGLSSRALKDEEKSDLDETVIAKDGICIIVNKDNGVADISLDDLAKVYKGEITNWKDLGGKDLEISVIGREAGSGTRDGFESITGTEEKCKYDQELTSTGDVITTVSGNENAIGYASLASVNDTINVLTVDGVEPSEDTIKDGTYKIQRPFEFITKKGTKLSDNAQKFFDYCTSSAANDVISNAGVVPVAE